MGAHVALNADEDLVSAVRHANEGRLADLVIICFDGFIPLSFKTVEKGGTILFFAGAGEGDTIPVPINDIFWRTEITLTSTYAGAPSDCREALNLIRAGAVPIQETITGKLPLEEASAGFKMVCSPTEHECIKVILEPNRKE
ncbi:MAG TPA: zinc-binding dehydrogenase, partial [Deltaproteobacteria bacterium]|nr:zinc-binding dehydrogenase [Deltaproteobacteria bacterium]